MQKCKRGKEKENVNHIYRGSTHSSSLELNPLFKDFTIENFLVFFYL